MSKIFTFFAAVCVFACFQNAQAQTLIQSNFTGVIVPQYTTPASADNGASPGRLPFIFRATVSELLPNTTYDYVIKAVTSGATTGWGSGDMLHITSSGTVSYLEGLANMNSAGVPTFTTDANGTYTGWFGLVQNST